MKSFGEIYKQYKWLWCICALSGLVVGLGAYTIYISRAWSYVSDNPAVCVNCHVMGSYYQAWGKSSHAAWTTCNDCHVPQDNVVNQYAFKAIDGLYHAAVFTIGAEPQVIRAREASSAVIMDNCIRCHSPLTTEFVKMDVDYKQALKGEAKACWDCHTQIPHTNISNLASAPGAIVPFPASPVPDWLNNMLK
ncbi:MAG: cytochrome c nitrite reductase small subunit [Candidatus Adiutrix sp.]|jgi:cytochrome c nitrite reductase small subunit|nr:cytochrome c nitrite reductase small subunit [Candidatus Adiutrix sp.]